MGLSPSPTFANVYSNHETGVLAHENLQKVFEGPLVGEVIQNGCGSEGVSTRVMVLGLGRFECQGQYKLA